MPYLNCPECFYRVRSEIARSLDGEASCPRCARLGQLVPMYSTEVSLRSTAEAAAGGEPLASPLLTGRDPQAPEAI